MATPLTSVKGIKGAVLWKNYTHKNQFTFLCTLTPDTTLTPGTTKRRERVLTSNAATGDMNRACVYILVVNGMIFKIGCALSGMKKRIASYNSGKNAYRFKPQATNSVSNWWALQSFINMGVTVEVYAHYSPMVPINYWGETLTEPFPPPKAIEAVVIRLFEQHYGKKPIGNVQS